MPQINDLMKGWLFHSGITGDGGTADMNPKPGPQAQPRNRYAVGVSTTLANFEVVDWPANANITELIIFCTPVTPEAAQTGDYGIIAIDPPVGLEENYLTQAESKSDDIQWLPIPPNEVVRIPLTEAMTQGQFLGGQVAMLSVGASMNFFVGAS